MSMIRNLIRFGKRQIHTLVSKEVIKPSSPTPSHLKTHNLSVFDQTIESTFMPLVTFYESNPNTNRDPVDKTLALKKSLSQTLTKYYTFAGRFAKTAPAFVDCNDHGAEFLEASIDSGLSGFLQNSKHDDLDQLFPYGKVWNRGAVGADQGDKVAPLAVQVNHFECGGVAVAISLSHKVADGTSLIHFVNDWGKMTRFSSSERNHISPEIVSYPSVNINFDGYRLEEGDDSITKSFTFPNSKLNDLKRKVVAMAAESSQPITNPTRVEVLNWLLYKSAVAAATVTNGSTFSNPSCGFIINIRNKMIERLPLNRIGNHFMITKIFTNNENEMKPEVFINDLKKQKMQVANLKNIKAAFDLVPNLTSEITTKEQKFIDCAYISSSLCGYPAYEIDFGWGKPVKASLAGGISKNSFVMIDAPNGDGIETFVCVGKKDMAIMENDPELLAYC